MRRLLLAATLLLLAVPAGAAAAPPTEIRFEGLPEFEQIRTQYAAQGVQFGRPSDFGLPEPPLGCAGPQAVNGGISGASAQTACVSGPAEFPTRRFAVAFEFSTERRSLSFRLLNRAANRGLPATLRAYGVAGNLLESRALSLPKDAIVDVAVSRPTAQIASIVLFGELGESEVGGILLDDVVALLDDVPPPPKWALALTSPSVDVVEGATVTAGASVRRFNGSSGPVTLTIPELPPGIVAAIADPNPVNGSSPVALRFTADRPFTAQRQVSVTASGGGGAGTGVVTSGVQTVQGLPAVQIAEGGRFVRTLAAGCGPQRFRESFTVRGGYVGSVNVLPLASGGLGATADPVSRFAGGDGLYSYDLVVDPATATGIQQVTLRTRPSDATSAGLDAAFRVSPVTIAAVSPVSFPRPAPGTTGKVTVRGQFPAACAISFQDGAGQAWPVVARTTVDVDGSSFDSWTLDVPRGAVSGPLQAVSPTGAVVARSTPFDVTDFRNVPALSGLNNGPGARTNAYTWADFERTFGDDDTESCFIVCVTDDHARTYYRRWRDQVQALPATGLCSGWVQMALRFRRGTQAARDYLPGATRAWAIPDSTVDGTAIKRDVVRWQVAQFDDSFQQERVRALARSAADERAVIKSGVAGGELYIGIRQGNAGHAVVGYDAQDITTPTGPGLTVSIYDPNIPYTTAEEGSSAVRTAATTGSTITIQGDGSWSGAGFPWSGTNATLMATTALPPDDAELPTSAGFVVSVFSSVGGDAPAELTGIEAGGRQALGAGGEPRPGTGVSARPSFTGAGAVPEYGLAAGRAYALTTTGTSKGSYEHGLIGGGASATVTRATAPGQKDTLTVRPGQAQLEFAPGGAAGAVEYALTDKAGKVTRSVQVATRAGKGSGDEVELSGGTVRLRHDGPAAGMAVTLRSSGEGLPGSVTTTPVRLGAGQRLELRPRSWADLADGLRLTIRDRRGRVVRRGSAKLRETRKVAVTRVRARRAGGKVTVTGRVARRGSAPVLVALVEQVRGGKVVARKGLTRRAGQVRAGRFSLPVAVGRVRAGARLRVTVTLLDDGEDRVAVRRRVAVR